MTLPLRGVEPGATVFERGIQFAVSDRVGTASLSGIFGDSSVIIMALLIFFVGSFDQFVTYPIPYFLVWYWIIAGFVQSVLLGIIAALVYRPKAA